MHILLVFIIVVGGFGLISADIPASTIDLDFAEIDKISNEFLIYAPDVVRQFTEISCKMVSECCQQLESTFLPMLIVGRIDELSDKCFGQTNSSKFLVNFMSCSPLMKLTTLLLNPELTKYISITAEKSLFDKEDVQMKLRVCSQKELYSVVCDWKGTDLQRACDRKALEKFAEQGNQIYKDKIQKTKKIYTKIANALKKEFKH